MRSAVRVVTWNLQGSKGVDAMAVGALLRAMAPDVVVLQEVQRAQASRLAAASGAPSSRWAFKHWPIVARAEGMAVLTSHRLVSSCAYVVHRAAPWSWRRRVVVEAVADVEGLECAVADVHLSPHDAADRRRREIDVVLGRRRTRPLIIAGDFNDDPAGPARAALVAAGWTDAWSACRPGDPGATNWSAGDRSGRPPTQRLDYVFAPPGWSVVDCDVLAAPLDELGRLSDHLPVRATLRRPEAA